MKTNFECGDYVNTGDGHLIWFKITEIHIRGEDIYYDLISVQPSSDKYNWAPRYEYKYIAEWRLVKYKEPTKDV